MTQLHTFVTQLEISIRKVRTQSELAIAWFEMNYMKRNTDKCHLLISGNKNDIWQSNDVELLRVKIDSNLRFDKRVSNICFKINRKLSALTRVAKFVPF